MECLVHVALLTIKYIYIIKARVCLSSLKYSSPNKSSNFEATFTYTLSHSLGITVIPSVSLSFLLCYCVSFCIIVIPSILVSYLLNTVISTELLSFQLFVILNSSCTLPYPKGEKIDQCWPAEPAIFANGP